VSDRFDDRWKLLLEATRAAPASEPRGPHPGWVEQVARRALLARTRPSARAREPIAWAGVFGLAAAAAVAVVVWPGAVVSTADVLTSGASALPRSLPHAPRLPRSPAAPRPSLPSREATVALVTRLPELDIELPFLPRRTVTP
jgi:hypothetical protein